MIRTLSKFAKNPYGGIVIDTTSNGGLYRDLSPFVLGPIKAFAGNEAQNLENFWQYHKVYKCHVGEDGEPTPEWFDWHNKGFADKRAHRYPMGRGARPEYSFWNGQHLGYIDARKQIYAPYYAKFVQLTNSFKELQELYNNMKHRELCGDEEAIVLLDYDAYAHVKLGMSLVDVINCTYRIMGHSFVLIMILEGKLEECINSPTNRPASKMVTKLGRS